jgi:hypothetical protein
VVAKGDEGARELQILQLLNSEPAKSDPDNATVPVVDFLRYDDWHFVVMPFCDGCDEVPLRNVGECLDFAAQVLQVSLFSPITSWVVLYPRFIGSIIPASKSYCTPSE